MKRTARISLVANDLIRDDIAASDANVQRYALNTEIDSISDAAFACFAAMVRREVESIIQERIDTARVLR